MTQTPETLDTPAVLGGAEDGASAVPGEPVAAGAAAPELGEFAKTAAPEAAGAAADSLDSAPGEAGEVPASAEDAAPGEPAEAFTPAEDAARGEAGEVPTPVAAGFLVSEEELAALEGAEPQFEAAPEFEPAPEAGDGAGLGDEAEDEDEGRGLRSFSPMPDRTGASLSPSGVAAEEVARAAAQALYDRKIEDIQVLDLTALSDVCDFFVIGTGLNTRMVDSAVDEVEEHVARACCGEKPFGIEGRDLRTWVLMDYGSVVVHVFTPEARDYYRLERLWGDAPQLELELD